MESVVIARKFTRNLQQAAARTITRRRTLQSVGSDINCCRCVLYCTQIPVYNSNVAVPTSYETQYQCQTRGETVLLSVYVLQQYASIVREHNVMFQKIDKPAMNCFVHISSIVLQKIQQTPNPDLSFWIEFIGQQSRMYFKDAPDLDTLLLETCNLHISLFKQAIGKCEPRLSIYAHPLFENEWRKIVLKRPNNQPVESLSPRIKQVFRLEDKEYQNLLQEVSANVTEQSVYLDIKYQIDDLQQDRSRGYMEHDFKSPQAYQTFKKLQLSKLDGILRTFLMLHPNSQQSGGRAGLGIPDNLQLGESYYRKTLELLLEDDLLNGEPELSKSSKAILVEIALRWRISQEYRDIALLDCLVQKYDSGVISLTGLQHSFHQSLKLSSHFEQMRKSDCESMLMVYQTLDSALMIQVGGFLHMAHLKNKDPSEVNALAVLCSNNILSLHQNPLWVQKFKEGDPFVLREIISNKLTEASVKRYNQATAKLDQALKDKHLLRLMTLLELLQKHLKKYKSYFKDPIVDLEIYKIAANAYLNTVRADVQNIQFLGEGSPIQEIFKLYDAVFNFYTLCEEDLGIPDARKGVDIDQLFAPYIRDWLSQTDIKWSEWVKRMYELDKEEGWKPIDPPKYMTSESVKQLFTAFSSGLEFMSKFHFTNPAISRTLEQYCDMIFAELAQERKGNFVFLQEDVVKLNNILNAQEYLETMLRTLKHGAQLSRNAERLESDPDFTFFNITLISASDLPPKDTIWRTNDCYITVHLDTTALGSTRVIKNTINPIWNERVPVQMPNALSDQQAFLHLVLYHENASGSDIEIGRSSIFLRDSLLEDFLSHPRELKLSSGGSMQIRMRRVGEINDIAWYVKRAEEVLRNSLEDMLRLFIGRFVNEQCKSLAKGAGGWSLDAIMGRKQQPITAQSAEKGLVPVFEFLDQILTVFNKNADRRFDRFLVKQYPMLVQQQDADQPEHSLSHDHRKIPLLTRVLWQELLIIFMSSLGTLDKSIEQHQRHIQVIDFCVEYMNSRI
ncbi:hypothetical protein EDD86DRAFT_245117 [Gorgonomyces haynaldii]|nr:hypothetical protein EDD86DRAFT_245117 [Gorgonomyces haynaldii]